MLYRKLYFKETLDRINLIFLLFYIVQDETISKTSLFGRDFLNLFDIKLDVNCRISETNSNKICNIDGV